MKMHETFSWRKWNDFILEKNDVFEESDYIEAGKLAGAEGVIFVSATCVNKHTEIDVSLSDTKTGSIQWSIHSENLDPHEIADRFIESVIED